MIWNPANPVRTSIVQRVNVINYPQDFSFDFFKCEFARNDGNAMMLVGGLEAFIQKVQKFVLTPKTEHWTYGFNHHVFTAPNQQDFDNECFSLASQMVNQVIRDSTPERPNGLGFYIEKITKMERYLKDERVILVISMFVTGYDGELSVQVPYLEA